VLSFIEVVANDFRNMGLFKISTKKTFLFVGPPRSGKTVFFSTMVDRLIRQAKDDGSSLTCIPEGKHSHKFVQTVIQSLQKQIWPKEGGTIDAFGELVYTLTYKGRLFDTQYQLSCCDYAGETFNAAYGDPDILESDVDKEQVDRLRGQVDSADVVFVIVDAVRLHNGDCPEIEDSLCGVAEVLKKRKKIRTALVLTQRDEFEEEDQEAVIEQLKEDYQGLHQTLRAMGAEFFWISSVVAMTDNKGRRVPPKKYKSERDSIDLLNPITWALKLPVQG